MERVLIFGSNGQVAWELQREFAARGVEPCVVGKRQVDISKPDDVRRAIQTIQPDVIVNAAAYTAVDEAEKERDICFAINAQAPEVMAIEASRLGALFVSYSTDYVFDGRSKRPYTEEDSPCPLNEYGRSKLEGDNLVMASGCRYLILRTSWVYGLRGKNFLRTILAKAETSELGVVNDQFGAPTWSRSVAASTVNAIRKFRDDPSARLSGVYNLTAQGSTTWYQFAKQILDFARELEIPVKARLYPIDSASRNAAALRPTNSVLSCQKYLLTFGTQMLPWEKALALVMKDFQEGFRTEGGRR